MTLPVLRPGQTHGAVPKFKRALVEELQSRNHRELASAIRLDSKTYGPTTVRATKRMQHNRQLEPDGIVGEKTWRALGFHEPVVDERPPVLHGVPFEPGLLAVDGRYVDKPLGQTILAERRARHWHGVVNSGYRPAWYQKRLWDEAVKKYGSEQAASKWVARPGRSRHGRKGGSGAVDVTNGAELDGASSGIFRPMDWEPWHMQLTGTRDMPEELPETREGPELTEVPEEELAEHGVTVDDVDATVRVLLERLDRPNDETDEGMREAADDGFDPEAIGATPTPERSTAT